VNTYVNPRNFGCRISEFTVKGHAAIAFQNESLRVTVLPGKGTDIVEFLYKPLDIDFLSLSYSGLRPAASLWPGSPDASSSFLDSYPGGWQEILPNFGDPCTYKGAGLGLHGEVCLLPWQYAVLQDDPSCVSVRFSVRCLRTPFLLKKTMTLGPAPVLMLKESLTNESTEPMDFTWGHHPALGGGFLDENCRLHLPPCRIKTLDDYVFPNSRLEKAQDTSWPFVKGRRGETIDLSLVPPPSAKSHGMAYLYDFPKGWYAITNPPKRIGFAMAWDHTLFKHLWFWQVFRGWAGYPWYGMSYNIGLEPCTSYPPTLAKAIDHGTQLRLAPGESLETELRATVFRDIERVEAHMLNGQF
jgi:Domain of unknown function (DUF4432)